MNLIFLFNNLLACLILAYGLCYIAQEFLRTKYTRAPSNYLKTLLRGGGLTALGKVGIDLNFWLNAEFSSFTLSLVITTVLVIAVAFGDSQLTRQVQSRNSWRIFGFIIALAFFWVHTFGPFAPS